MQSLSWYYRRLRGMSGKEITWRARSVVRDATDRALFKVGSFPLASIPKDFGPIEPAFRLADMHVGEWAASTGQEGTWRDALVAYADDLRAHRLTFFNLRQKHLGDPINWNHDHSAGVAAPMAFSPSIDYRDFSQTGDCKLVWEPNRHHHLVVLARAYRATGRLEYAQEVVAQLESWFEQCPFGVGMNWRSPLEFGVRLINHVWAIDLIMESGLFHGEFRERFLRSIYLHIWSINRAYSRGSSANNHTIGEAAGAYVAAAYFEGFSERKEWMAEAKSILVEQIFEQSFEDGASREQAFGYQLFVLWLFFLAGDAGNRAGDPFPQKFWDRLERMMDFVGVMTESGGIPRFGDCDDAYVLDLGATHGDVAGLMSLGAIVFNRPEFKHYARGFRESSRWILGRSARERFDALPFEPSAHPLCSRSFQQAGMYLLQSGTCGAPDGISVLFDCAELGFRSIAAHGHADALSFSLFAFGREVLVDPGTYDYFTFPDWRKYFRTTAAHNTVEIDAVDQSVMLGPFLWGDRARSRCLEWKPLAGGGRVVGEHDGYTRLPDPVIHTRALELNGEARTLVVQDDLISASTHKAVMRYHVAPGCGVVQESEHRIRIETESGTAIVECDPDMKVEIVRASDDTKLGWVSRGYHSKAPGAVIVLSGTLHGRHRWTTRIDLSAIS